MKEVRFSSFDEFIRNYSSHFPKRPTGEAVRGAQFSHLLFRGHSRASFKLRTTLERLTSKTPYALSEYIQVMLDAYPEFTSYTKHEFEIDCQQAKENPSWSYMSNSAGLMGFMIYLRHVGFPSPLLDWSRSPYVAAFFAYSEAQEEDIAIYAYLEFAGSVKHFDPLSPYIESAGSYQRTSERHHIQQAEYSVCLLNEHDKEFFTAHEAAFIESNDRQDILVKFVLPSSERLEVMRQLGLMNINSYTLFRSEEGLAKLLARKIFNDVG